MVSQALQALKPQAATTHCSRNVCQLSENMKISKIKDLKLLIENIHKMFLGCPEKL